MNWIDTHTHLYAEDFSKDQSEMMKRAIDSGIECMLLPNIDMDSIESMNNLYKQYPAYCRLMMGLHPCSVDEKVKSNLDQIEQLIEPNKHIAIGEIGIDLYWDKSFLKEQEYAFRRQIDWAKNYNLPIVIHCREAFDEIFHILDELNDESLTGVFHCFTGTYEQATRVLNYGNFKLGIGGVLTYKNSGLDRVVEKIDIEHLVLETDAPYLSPVPYRGKRNESSYLLHIAEKLAEIKQQPLKVISEITTKNAIEIFRLAE